MFLDRACYEAWQNISLIYSRKRYSVTQAFEIGCLYVLILYIFSELICANMGDFMLNTSRAIILNFCKSAKRVCDVFYKTGSRTLQSSQTLRKSINSWLQVNQIILQQQSLFIYYILHTFLHWHHLAGITCGVLPKLNVQNFSVTVSSHHKCLPAGGHIKGEKLQNSHLTSSSTHSPINHAVASFTL